MKEAVTKVIDTLKQDDFHRAFQKLLERYNKCIATGGDYFEGHLSFMCVLSIKVLIRKKSGNLFNDPRIYIYIYLYDCFFDRFYNYFSALGTSLSTWVISRTGNISLIENPIRVMANQSRSEPLKVPSVSRYLEISFGLGGGGLPPRLLLPSGGWVHRPAPEAPSDKGNADGAVGIFGNAGRVWALALRSDPPKKGLVPHLLFR